MNYKILFPDLPQLTNDFLEFAEECNRMSEFDRINMLRDKKGVFLGRYAENPLTGEQIPIYAGNFVVASYGTCLLYTSPSPRDRTRSRMPSSA